MVPRLPCHRREFDRIPRQIGWFAASALTLVVGCAQILGADDYEKAPVEPDAAGAEDAGPDLDPAGGDEAGMDTGAADAATFAPIAPGACGLPYGTPDCATCAAAHCCEESTACSKDPACAPYAECLGVCNGDPTCRATCGAPRSAPNSSAGSALSACLVAQCESECGLTCGAPSTYGVPPFAAPACQDCIAAKGGCDTARACGASAPCDAVRRCAMGATTFDSLSVCWDDAPEDGAALAKALDSTISECAAECALGADWSCVGHVSWPAPKSDTVTLTFDVTDFGALLGGSRLLADAVGLPNVDVSICSAYGADCGTPLDQGPTDDTGRVVLQAPRGWDGYTQVTSPDFVPSIFYSGSPVAESKFVQTTDSHFGPLGVFKPADLQRIYDLFGFRSTWESHGAIRAIAWDCDLFPASKVQIEISPTAPEVSMFYDFNPSATEGATAYFANVPEGVVDVIVTPQALGKPSSRKSVIVRAGWVTSILMVPTP